MALQLDFLVGTVAYSLTAGTPFRIERAEGLGAAPVRRLNERGPLQNGDTDLGYRLDPRIVTLALNFSGTSDAAVDTARSLLSTIAQATTSTPLRLRATRDDGGVRYLDCHVFGNTDFPLVNTDRAGKTMRTVIQLRAPNPLWYSSQGIVVGTAIPAVSATDWPTAGTVIPAAYVREATLNPGTAQAWTYMGTPTSWTIAIASPYVDPNSSGNARAYEAIGTNTITFRTNSATFYSAETNIGPTAMAAGTNTYMQIYDNATGTTSVYRNGTVLLTARAGTYLLNAPPETRRWRAPGDISDTTSYWPVALPKVAIYDTALGSAQRVALTTSMLGTTTTTATINYAGDMPEYPILTLTGSGTAPSIFNDTSSAQLSFQPSMVLTEDNQITIDLRPGYLTVTDVNGVNRIADLYDAGQLSSWSLVPTAGGTNSLYVVGGSLNLTVQYVNRYLGY